MVFVFSRTDDSVLLVVCKDMPAMKNVPRIGKNGRHNTKKYIQTEMNQINNLEF